MMYKIQTIVRKIVINFNIRRRDISMLLFLMY